MDHNGQRIQPNGKKQESGSLQEIKAYVLIVELKTQQQWIM
jgi:hypothetical protein